MSKIIPFSRLRADIARSGSARMRELLSSPDPAEVVARLDPVDLFSLVQEVGELDAIDVLALADAEQMKRVVDLGAFRKDAPDLAALERYLGAAIALGPGQATALFEKLDEELQTLYLAGRFNVYDARDEALPDPVSEDAERYLTPDGTFVIEVKAVAEEKPDESLPAAANDMPPPGDKPFSPLALIADLYYVDWRRADTMMRDAKWAIAAELEEELLRVRQGRMEEMGFPPLEDAMKVFTRPASDQLASRSAKTEERSSLPTLYAGPFLSDSFFMRALGLVTDGHLVHQLESELVFLVNAACVVNGIAVPDRELVQLQATDVRNLVSLGLEAHAQGNVEAAASAIAQHPLRAFVGVALAQVFKLADWARRAEVEGLFRLPGLERRVLTSEDEHFLRALLAKHPRYAEKGLESSRAFGSRLELQDAHRRLERMAKQLMCVRWLAREMKDFRPPLEGCIPGPGEVTPESLLRSLLLRKAIGASLGDSFAVTRADLKAFAEKRTELLWPPELAAELTEQWRSLTMDVEDAGADADPRFLSLITKGD